MKIHEVFFEFLPQDFLRVAAISEFFAPMGCWPIFIGERVMLQTSGF